MTNEIVPPEVKLAAKRAAAKTAAQAARGAGAAIVGTIGLSVLGVDWLAVAATAGASLITVAWAAADAYLDKIHNGIPVEYVAAGLVESDDAAADESAGEG
ncbi:hypothetical protein [Microbacterium sp.]|uniref:hypothetical protein n=1 Tax=Microbacterium sp. TaxID=51671 RepID=UPI0039E262D1